MAQRNSEDPLPKLASGLDRAFDDDPLLSHNVTDPRNLDALFIPGAHTWTTKTIIKYRRYWTMFVDWCESRAFTALPAEQATVLEFIKSRFDPTIPVMRKKTVGIILAAIGHANMQLTGNRSCVQAALKHLKTVEDPPIGLPIANRLTLDAFLEHLPDDLQGARIKCVLNLIYEELLHMPEIVALTLDDCERPIGGNQSFLRYRSAISKEVDWHPLSARSTDAIHAWIVAARITAGPLLPRLSPGGTVTARATSKARLEHAISQAHTQWDGPRISAQSLRRGRSANGMHPDSDPECRPEQWRRMGIGKQQFS